MCEKHRYSIPNTLRRICNVFGYFWIVHPSSSQVPEGVTTINMRIQYVGRTTYCEGKRLYDMLCRLKNFGVGRIVVRNHYLERYPEPTYYVIGKVMPDMSDPTQVIRLSTVRAPVLFTCEPISTGSKDVYNIITNLRPYVKIFSFFLLSASPFSISP